MGTEQGAREKLDQSRAPLLEALADYQRLGRYGFTPPGHRQGRGADERVLKVIGRDAFAADVLASPGLDDRLSQGGYLAHAEELMAAAVGADQAFFSTCGSSLSVKAAMMAVAGGCDGGLLVARDCHKSIVAGLIFSGVLPRWITPRWDTERHFTHPPSPEQVRAAWDKYPDAAGALIVSPSPYGTCADIEGIAKVCHERGKPLIVDEAWGAHLPFHPGLPTWAMDVGADVCVVSVHKMGAGFEQGSVFHLQGDLVDPVRLRHCADLLMTTSPNVLVYTALDGWRRQMVQHGREIFDRALDTARRARTELDRIPGIRVMEDELLGVEASHDLDRLQVLMDVSETGVSGYEADAWLRDNCRIDLGLSDHRRLLATLSLADDAATVSTLVSAMRTWRAQARPSDTPREIRVPGPDELLLETAMLPRDAFFGPTEMVPLDAAAGRIAAEQLTPYPPGIPVVVPGERLGRGVLEYVRTGHDRGMNIPDASDPELKQVRVVAGGS
ncbi:aminotransferase class I/II-fold pyridoxal phosphate-dependent enzyme [Nocardia carnea]|uniref:aminotransferase class I/II-fold pyridoxal phosphate-dependent enzyme n=1 Tax=Nocardia carnea TaxID=37328 RepID=UPI002453F086|nr:PLP-dependent transferase [Nocardia carnea]